MQLQLTRMDKSNYFKCSKSTNVMVNNIGQFGERLIWISTNKNSSFQLIRLPIQAIGWFLDSFFSRRPVRVDQCIIFPTSY